MYGITDQDGPFPDLNFDILNLVLHVLVYPNILNLVLICTVCVQSWLGQQTTIINHARGRRRVLRDLKTLFKTRESLSYMRGSISRAQPLTLGASHNQGVGGR